MKTNGVWDSARACYSILSSRRVEPERTTRACTDNVDLIPFNQKVGTVFYDLYWVIGLKKCLFYLTFQIGGTFTWLKNTIYTNTTMSSQFPIVHTHALCPWLFVFPSTHSFFKKMPTYIHIKPYFSICSYFTWSNTTDTPSAFYHLIIAVAMYHQRDSLFTLLVAWYPYYGYASI